MTLLAYLGISLSGVAQTAERLSIGFREDAPPFVSRINGSRVGADVEPAADYEGFTADICRDVLRSVQSGAPQDVTIEVFPVTASTRFQGEDKRKRTFDILCDTTSITRERLEFCSFSFPYFVTGISYANAKGGKRIADFENEQIGLVGGTTAVERLNLEWERRFSKLPDVTQYEDYKAGIISLESGEIKALFGDQILLEQANKDFSNRLSVSSEIVSTELYGLCINPERPDLLRKSNETLAEMFASGRIYSLINEHFGSRGASRFLIMLYSFFSVPEK